MSGSAGTRVVTCFGSKLLYNFPSVSRLRGFERCGADVAVGLSSGSGETGLAAVAERLASGRHAIPFEQVSAASVRAPRCSLARHISRGGLAREQTCAKRRATKATAGIHKARETDQVAQGKLSHTNLLHNRCEGH